MIHRLYRDHASQDAFFIFSVHFILEVLPLFLMSGREGDELKKTRFVKTEFQKGSNKN